MVGEYSLKIIDEYGTNMIGTYGHSMHQVPTARPSVFPIKLQLPMIRKCSKVKYFKSDCDHMSKQFQQEFIQTAELLVSYDILR